MYVRDLRAALDRYPEDAEVVIMIGSDSEAELDIQQIDYDPAPTPNEDPNFVPAERKLRIRTP